MLDAPDPLGCRATPARKAARHAPCLAGASSFGRGGPVAYFRLYFMESFSGHIEYVRDFEADSDEIAEALAEDARGIGPMELWKGRQKVKRWEARPPELC